MKRTGIAGVVISCVLLLFPYAVRSSIGAVVINEIAWMGTESSANDEWIELRNNSSETVDITNWTLKAQDGTPEIILQGEIAPGGFFLLERTDDNTISDIEADQVYTGALGNKGEVLELRDADGNIIDAVDAWYGGDNDSKSSMERVDPEKDGDNDSNWATNTAQATTGKDSEENNINGTPRSENSVYLNPSYKEDVPLDGGSEDNDFGKDREQEPSPSVNHPPQAVSGGNIVTLVGQRVFFDGSESFDPDNDELVLTWNLGDGTVLSGKKVEHKYVFPGTYLVTLEAFDGEFRNASQLTVYVYPGGVIINEFLPNPEGSDKAGEFIELYNGNSYFVDLSGFMLDDKEGGSRPYIFPKFTFIAPKGFLIFTRPITKIALNNDSDSVRLLYPNGDIADSAAYNDVAKEGFSASRQGDGFYWSSTPSPGLANIILQSNDASGIQSTPLVVNEVNESESVKYFNEFTPLEVITSIPSSDYYIPRNSENANVLNPDQIIGKTEYGANTKETYLSENNEALSADPLAKNPRVKVFSRSSDFFNKANLILFGSILISSTLFGIFFIKLRRLVG